MAYQEPDAAPALDYEPEALYAEYDALCEADAARTERYETYEWEYTRARDLEMAAVTDYGRKPDEAAVQLHDIPMPYVHAITTKHTFRVAGRLPDLIRPRLNSTPPERFRSDTVEKMLYAAYGYSKAKLQFASAAHDGSLHGAGVLDVRWDVSYQLPCFRALGPGAFHVVPGLEDPHEFERAYRSWTVPIQTFRATYGSRPFADGSNAMEVTPTDGMDGVTIVQCWTRNSTLRFVGRRLISARRHGYGFVSVVVIPNLGPLREVWGYSDYEFYRHIGAYYEALLSREADIIRAVANGAYTEDGTGVAATTIRKALRVGGVVPIRAASTVKPIEVARMPDFAPQHIQDVRAALGDLGFSPPASFGAIGAASGSDRALQLAPQIELTALKQIHWEAGLKRLNGMLLRLMESQSVGQTTSYRGTDRNGGAFSIVVDAAAQELDKALKTGGTLDANGQPFEIPSTPKLLIAGDYETEVVFQQRLDREDPQFILSELNKFSQGAQSLRTTLENLGCIDPEAEIALIEEDNVRNAVQQQMQNPQAAATPTDPSAGAGAGAQGDIPGGLAALMGPGGGLSGALSTDAVATALNGSSNRGTSTDGAPPGAPYGAA